MRSISFVGMLAAASAVAVSAAMPATAVTPGVPADAATVAQTEQLTALTHNVQGTRSTPDPADRGKNSAVDYTIAKIKEHNGGLGSDVVMLQEICLHQAAYVASKLSGYGVAFAPKRANLANCTDVSPAGVNVASKGYFGIHANDTPSNNDYGSAVLVKGPIDQAFSPDLFDAGGSTEDFKAICIDTSLKGVPTTACSIKLPSGDSSAAHQVRKDSTQDLATRFAGRAKGRLVAFGGDFNAEPHHVELTSLYRTNPGGAGYYVEGDQTDNKYFLGRCSSTAGSCRAGESTHPTPSDATTPNKPRKYDYIFFSDITGATYDVTILGGNADCEGDCSIRTNIPAGDHALFTASAELTF